MKAILIDPTRREVRGIEVEATAINAAINNRQTKTLILQTMIGFDKMLFYDGHARAQPSPGFWLKGVRHHIVGRGLLLGRQKGQWPVATALTVREVECLVRFDS